jgi:arylsulfatase A-like enzyme
MDNLALLSRLALPLVLLGCVETAPHDMDVASDLTDAAGATAGRPHIVLILADDLGYGDVGVLAPGSKLPTPRIDRLASEGMLFTDAHSPSAVCTPTRYGLLTGRYAWRTRLKSGVLVGSSPPLIDADRSTLGTLLGRAGYRTACIGKWHLGLGWTKHDDDIDVTGQVAEGPVTRGFDHFFGIPASLDFPPYVYINDDRVTETALRSQPGSKFPAFLRAGNRAADLDPVEVSDRLVRASLEFIQESARGEQPFFLYLALSAPHKPVLPHPRFRGATELGDYGDFVAQVDAAVGAVLDGLQRAGVAEQTLVIVTSDNGSFMHSRPDEPDHIGDPSVQAYHPSHHRSNGPWRGTKADIWEAGHRVPFVVRWPGVVAPSVEDTPIGLIDVYATLAELTGQPGTAPAGEVSEGASGQDSWSLLSLLRGQDSAAARPALVHHSINGTFAIRDGRWKLVLANGSGGREKPVGRPFGEPFQLYDLQLDPSESRDRAALFPDVVARLSDRLTELAGVDDPRR